MVGNLLLLQRLVHLDGQQAVIYKALKHNLALGLNFETMDLLEWLARWQITSRTRGSIARSSTATMPTERGETAPREEPGWAGIPRACAGS